MSTQKSPFAPKRYPQMKPIAGVSFSSYACGLRYKGRDDLMIAELAPGSTVAGVFTRSLTASAPVEWCKEALAFGKVRALVVNSGNSNAFTGKSGVDSVKRTVERAAREFLCRKEEVYVASTGTIGVPLDDSKITAAIPLARAKLKDDRWLDAAKAIMTTDTYPKLAIREADIGGIKVTIGGFAKGSGMIAPDMATMLSFVFTDAKLPHVILQKLLASGVEKSFNSITVDSDTSTSDTLLLFATGQASHKEIKEASDPALKDFSQKLDLVLLELAHHVVKDGEGASKFVAITVTGATSIKSAKKIGMSIANSPLVKTAIAGEDANWGRIVMAVGKAGEKADRDKLSISIGGVEVAHNGEVAPGYNETPVNEHMKGNHIDIRVDVGVGKARATVWTCDFTHRYIDINGSYRT